jgi:hypothetical protein
MSSSRESIFECVLAADRREYRLHVRAWSATEAEERFRASLGESGVRDVGSLRIRDIRRVHVLLRHGARVVD